MKRPPAKRKSDTHSSISESVKQPKATGYPTPLVFISHDSEDANLAEAFGNLLLDVSAGTLKSFRSSDRVGIAGLPFGTEWYDTIMTKIEDATDVVALLTPHSINRPWILFEAGVAKGKKNINVLGIALGVPLKDASSGPFAQFHNCAGDENSLTKLVVQLLTRVPNSSPRDAAIRVQVRHFLEKLKEAGTSPAKPVVYQDGSGTRVAELFEEVRAMVRELPEKVDNRLRVGTAEDSQKRRQRFNLIVFEDRAFQPERILNTHEPALGWLLFISIFRDEAPWLYELGLELYRAMRARDREAIAVVREDLRAMLDAACSGFVVNEFLNPKTDEAYMWLRFLSKDIPRFLDRLEKRLFSAGEPPAGAHRESNPETKL